MAIYSLGDQVPEIHPDAYIHPDAVIIGNVVIGAYTSVWPAAVLRGDDGFIFVGERCSVQDGAVLHTTAVFPTTVGNEVTIGHLAHLEGCTVEDRHSSARARSCCTMPILASRLWSAEGHLFAITKESLRWLWH
jgi:carbonic anhydrase/acetyltransferase-like protein (isoleucine patch superfamily)